MLNTSASMDLGDRHFYQLWAVFSLINLLLVFITITSIQQSRFYIKMCDALNSLSFLRRKQQRERSRRDWAFPDKTILSVGLWTVSAFIIICLTGSSSSNLVTRAIGLIVWLTSIVLIPLGVFKLPSTVWAITDNVDLIIALIRKARLVAVIEDEEPGATELRKQEARWIAVEERWDFLIEYLDQQKDWRHVPISREFCNEEKPLFDENVKKLWELGYEVTRACPCEKASYLCLRPRPMDKPCPV